MSTWCAPPEMIARLSLKGLKGVLDNFGGKKKQGVAFWGNFGENLISAQKKLFNHVHLVHTIQKSLPGCP